MKKQELVLFGGGGHAKSVIDVITSGNEFVIHGIIDVKEKVGTKVCGFPINGTEEDIFDFDFDNLAFHVSIGHILSNEARLRIYSKLKKKKAYMPPIISKKAHVSKFAEIGQGSFVGHHAVINAGAVIGENTIINTGAIVEHDSIIGNHTHISTQTTVNADCYVGDHCFLSSHVVMNRGLKINNNILVYSGSLITKSFSESNLSLKGIPAEIIDNKFP